MCEVFHEPIGVQCLACEVRYGSWPCENSSALRTRRSISEKLELNHPTQIQLDTVSENCFFYISPMYEFSQPGSQADVHDRLRPSPLLTSKRTFGPTPRAVLGSVTTASEKTTRSAKFRISPQRQLCRPVDAPWTAHKRPPDSFLHAAEPERHSRSRQPAVTARERLHQPGHYLHLRKAAST